LRCFSLPSKAFTFTCLSHRQCSLQLFHTRYALHKRAYQHRVGAAVELMLLEVMLLADPHLKFSGTEGQLRRMSECPSDMAAYWKLSDSVIKQIEASYSEVGRVYGERPV
jgi:hypothetical protein